jgi:hypothetical protein
MILAVVPFDQIAKKKGGGNEWNFVVVQEKEMNLCGEAIIYILFFNNNK